MSLSPSVRRSLVGKSEFFRMIPPSQDLSILFDRSVTDLALETPWLLPPLSKREDPLLSLSLPWS